FLKRRLLTQAQLKAAMDYQISVGGRLADVILKLGLVREEALRSFLDRLATGEDFVLTDDEGTFEAAAETLPPIDVDKLRVHRKLLEKVPREIIDRYGILFFFPPPKTRAILMSSEREIPPQGVDKLASLLGVEIRVIELESDWQAYFRSELDPGRPREKRPDSAPKGGKSRASSSNEPDERTLADLVSEVQAVREKERGGAGANGHRGAPNPGDLSRIAPGVTGQLDPIGEIVAGVDERDLVRAVLALLVKKNLVAIEEVAVEVEIARVKSRKHSGILG
ncbi:MAG TPA: hypothetical protein VK116_15285, partial [Planctomycetota bacterium]|nr:hypothetical protein [Planctomycetota bacterium]